MSKDPIKSLGTNSDGFLPPKNVEITPKLAKMLQMYETCVKNVWMSAKEWVKVCNVSPMSLLAFTWNGRIG